MNPTAEETCRCFDFAHDDPFPCEERKATSGHFLNLKTRTWKHQHRRNEQRRSRSENRLSASVLHRERNALLMKPQWLFYRRQVCSHLMSGSCVSSGFTLLTPQREISVSLAATFLSSTFSTTLSANIRLERTSHTVKQWLMNPQQ
ncbi:hypothetical protein INR49_025544 [Caranx melampygus]|nr:hypothetical protein INR49_025544 [Caranx melampygus]